MRQGNRFSTKRDKAGKKVHGLYKTGQFECSHNHVQLANDREAAGANACEVARDANGARETADMAKREKRWSVVIARGSAGQVSRGTTSGVQGDTRRIRHKLTSYSRTVGICEEHMGNTWKGGVDGNCKEVWTWKQLGGAQRAYKGMICSYKIHSELPGLYFLCQFGSCKTNVLQEAFIMACVQYCRPWECWLLEQF